MTVVLFCVLSSRMTTEDQKVPYWFDERHKCWLQLCRGFDLTSTNPIDVMISEFPILQDFHSDRRLCLNRSDIEFFNININPNDNLCLNLEYYKSLHRYMWRMNFKNNGNDDQPGVVSIHDRKPSRQIVFFF